ncbi:MAG: bifunctional DNA-binding transcriptional regulator/O6-methylguanine-DNA methyltransferase Ada [Chloroflexi bacterium]|nr:bifunctional DNA-binding transcriptional regulator/O6-methylguanine-DNA methyltransferase Ada [Chloroflexota bacterium]
MSNQPTPPTTPPPALDPAACWQAVENRDPRADGTFVFAVQTTGIYCRPSCPARRPRRDHVTFFATPQAAAQAGYRACRRCRPDEADAQIEMIRQACDYIEAHLDDRPTLTAIGAQIGVSPAHLQRVFKRLTGITPRQYADAQRLARFKTQLQDGASVTDALYAAGYGSSSRIYPGQLGMTPTDYRQRGQAMHIHYAITECRLGFVLVAATERGICSVTLGDTPEALENALREEFTAADIVQDAAGLHHWINAILSYLDGEQPQLDHLPLDVQATAFQRRVWEALRAIPYGSTRSYAEIAAALGQPSATRAVARACATNPTALIVPCHRVVRSDGGLSGYRWGVERKRALLEQERAAAGTLNQQQLL